MRLLTKLVLIVCALPVLSGCYRHHRHHGCLFSRHYQHCVGDHDWDDDDCDDWDDCCSPCGSPCDCGCGPTFSDYGAPWTSDCGCSAPMPAYSSFPAPMTYEMPGSSGCNCGASQTPTFQQPTYMQTPMPDPTPATTPPTPAGASETYYTPRSGNDGFPPPVPPVSFVPTRF
jgi:hypothetical protein